jgi:hypothetical protein
MLRRPRILRATDDYGADPYPLGMLGAFIGPESPRTLPKTICSSLCFLAAFECSSVIRALIRQSSSFLRLTVGGACHRFFNIRFGRFRIVASLQPMLLLPAPLEPSPRCVQVLVAADGPEDVAVVADGAGDEKTRLFEGMADGYTTRDFADAGATVAIVDNGEVASEVGGVCTAEIQQYAVMAGDGITSIAQISGPAAELGLGTFQGKQSLDGGVGIAWE